jgi:hypothetical protein
MASGSDTQVDLYIAAHSDQDAARGDWDASKQVASDNVIKVIGLDAKSELHMAFQQPRSCQQVTSAGPSTS